MPVHLTTPTVIKAAGNKPKLIEEFVGRVNSGDSDVSVARMKSPGGAEYIAVCIPAFSPTIVHREMS